MYLFCKSSAESVYTNTRESRTDPHRLSLHGCRGGMCAGQIVLREHADFVISSVSFSDFSAPFICGEGSVRYLYQDTVTYNDGVPYPDKLSDAKSREVKAEYTQSIWIIADIDRDAVAGLCRFNAVIDTTAGVFTVPCTVRVYGVTLPDADEGEFCLEYFLNPFYEEAGEIGSAKWYAFLESYAGSLSYLRNNSFDVCFMPLLTHAKSKRVSETEWDLDFSFVDEYLDFMLERVPVKHISARSVIASVFGKTIPVIDYDGSVKNVEYTEKDAELWAYAYFGGLYRHFKERGQLGLLQFRLQDEPHYTEAWKWAREICRKAAPGVVCGEPIDEHPSGLGLEGYCDQFIPRINVYEEGADYYDRRKKAGDQLWVYSCCFPEEAWFLNKFIDQPHRYSRMMSWACYARGIDGFLHWGYNYWSETSLYGTSPAARFKGDGFIVYYDKENNRVTPSNRYFATLEGITEYELLKIVEKKDPALARSICLSVARSFTDFDGDPAVLDSAKIKLLAAAEACSL